MANTLANDGIEVLSKISGMDRSELKVLWEQAKENHVKLQQCRGPHEFHDDTPNKVAGKTYRCAICEGTASADAVSWYKRGLEDQLKVYSRAATLS